jgi:hypothetical protein
MAGRNIQGSGFSGHFSTSNKNFRKYELDSDPVTCTMKKEQKSA